ncbi:MAG: GNAT family N-acetyltransferase [Alphaproteobacteria bacterium]|nr:MAG: GNAT family N-acetyltransferase [Alphaproteobacteria bacterium]
MPLALRTPRLLLREWRDEDLAPFVAMSADPEAMRYLPSLERSAAEAWVPRMHRHFGAHGFGNFVVELPGKASFIGVVGLNHVRWNLAFTPAVEAAWRLMPAYWGQGYALEAARAALDDGFGRIGLAEIVAYTVPANRASWQVMERLGMTRDPTEDFDHPSRPEGDALRRHVLYRLRRAQR